MMYTLEREQEVHCNLASAWDFLKNPANLNRITPEDLDFHIVSDVPAEMYNGLIVEYLITIPVIGKQRWVTEIKHIRNYAFVDEQRLGPYTFWFHYHELNEINGRVKSIDRVHYKVPFGIIGKVLHFLFIGRTLERIFAFRRQKLAEILDKRF